MSLPTRIAVLLSLVASVAQAQTPAADPTSPAPTASSTPADESPAPTAATPEAATPPADAADAAPADAAPTSEPAAAPASAPAAEEEEELDLDSDDAVVEAPPPPPSKASHGSPAPGGHAHLPFHLFGRFDLNLEWRNPTEAEPVREVALTNYHAFVFVKASLGGVTFLGEVLQRTFFTGSGRPVPGLQLTGGKILVPFGAPGYHRYYGGVQGDPLKGIFLPVVWGEYGVQADIEAFRHDVFSVDVTGYVVRGITAGSDKLPATAAGAVGRNLAAGTRLALGWGKVKAWFSGYTTEWKTGHGMFLYAADLATEYGLVPLPVLKDLRFLAGAARVDFTGGERPQDWRSGDYLTLEYRAPVLSAVARLRYGTYVHDSKGDRSKDVHNWNLAVTAPIAGGLSGMVEYLWNMEEVNEVPNDLLRIMLALDF